MPSWLERSSGEGGSIVNGGGGGGICMKGSRRSSLFIRWIRVGKGDRLPLMAFEVMEEDLG